MKECLCVVGVSDCIEYARLCYRLARRLLGGGNNKLALALGGMEDGRLLLYRILCIISRVFCSTSLD